MKAPKQARTSTKSPFIHGDDGRIIGRIDENGNIIATDEFDDVWNGQEHGKNMWIVWWVLATVVVTLGAVIITFVMLRKKHFGAPSKSPSRKSNIKMNRTQGIEMNKVNYHSVQKHTIKPAQTANDSASEPGNQTEEETLKV